MKLQTCADAGLQGSRKTAAAMSSEFTGDHANTKCFLYEVLPVQTNLQLLLQPSDDDLATQFPESPDRA